MIDALKSRATAALNHRDLAEILGCIPAAERSDPRMVASWLRAASSVEPRLADLAAFRAAIGAVHAWGDGAALADRAARLYHDPALRSEFGEHGVDYYWRHPEEAYQMLVSDAARRGKDAELAHEVLEVIAGARVMAEEHGLPWGDRPASSPIPGDTAAQDFEYQTLISRDPRTLSSAEHTRLLALAGHRVDREERDLQQAIDRQQAPQPPASDSEYRSLIARSLKGPLSPADEARLGQLATRRALDEGHLDPAEAFGGRDPAPADPVDPYRAGAPVRGRAPAPEPRVAAWDDAAAHARAVAAGVAGMYPRPQSDSAGTVTDISGEGASDA